RKVVDSTGDCWPLLVDLADRADDDADGEKGLRFSYRWDLGTARLVMIDSRNGRILSGGSRKMLSDREFAWLEEQMTDGVDRVDHVILGSSLPWLLPPALGDLQTINEIA
ncbi:alkaline phosphatase family protein, partial [Streptomyces sp. SID10244]|nr:alkaline phosphatase family protein [Streptomyces sp. SID10244]